MSIAETVAKILLEEKAVFLRPAQPFTWTSGIKSPVYCDNRLLISSVKARKKIISAFCELTASYNVDVVAGTATAGIPWAAWVAQELDLPLVYVRSSSKDHGRQNSIEGFLQKGQKCILIEDLISTGKSSLSAALKLKDSGVEVKSILSIFSYDFLQAQDVFRRHQVQVDSLSNFEILAKVAYDENLLDQSTLEKVLEWRKSVQFP
jgi:orotate phosphoribosyltransferase